MKNVKTELYSNPRSLLNRPLGSYKTWGLPPKNKVHDVLWNGIWIDVFLRVRLPVRQQVQREKQIQLEISKR